MIDPGRPHDEERGADVRVSQDGEHGVGVLKSGTVFECQLSPDEPS